ncbi:NAD-dependent epimerase/dehydratase family protein [Streptomyces sp. NPDC002667]|uniref:NAD-dependent epimerase/dehydratase family protein n=1 Tax=Streptomyces sp. NPDC002667 TaxID=3364657 RepID=UPI00369586A4
MRPLEVLLTGATGFVGSEVLRTALRGRADGRAISVRALARATPPGGSDTPGLSWVPGDLSDPSSLHGVARGADVLVHLASRVSGSEQACETVNVHGTRALLEEARSAGVSRIVHLSTAAVYGPGPHRGIAVDEVGPAPVSPASATRLAGERLALEAGAVVLRPGLVLGAGDRWVVPALSELRSRVPAHWGGGSGMLSVVDVTDLARLIVTLAGSGTPAGPAVHHASHPVPVANRDLMAALTEHGLLDPVTADWSWEACLRQLRQVPGTMSERQFSLLARDHWYRSEEIWRIAGCPAGPGPLARLAGSASWYRVHLAAG